MASPNRRAVTKIDVVVLITTLGMLLLLLPSCLVEQRGPHGKANCMNNQKQVSLAALIFESVNSCFPGYVNRLQKDDSEEFLEASWVVMLLPYLERNQLWEEWYGGNPKSVFMKLLVCPRDMPKSISPDDAPLSYVANCGRAGDEDTQADGVFFNQAVDEPVEMSIDYLSKHDGSASTLMLSENIQAGYWTDTAEADVGMVWWDEPKECERMNQCTDVGDRPQDIGYARPSSHHGNGVIVAFCDGHIRFLRNDIGYNVYKQLMAPDDGGPEESELD